MVGPMCVYVVFRLGVVCICVFCFVLVEGVVMGCANDFVLCWSGLVYGGGLGFV